MFFEFVLQNLRSLSIVQKHFFWLFFQNVYFSRQLRFQSGIEAQFKRFHSQQEEERFKRRTKFFSLVNYFVSGGRIEKEL